MKPLTVYRKARDRSGRLLGVLSASYDGTEFSMRQAAESVTAQMYSTFEDARNMESEIFATDAKGRKAFTVSPNFAVIRPL